MKVKKEYLIQACINRKYNITADYLKKSSTECFSIEDFKELRNRISEYCKDDVTELIFKDDVTELIFYSGSAIQNESEKTYRERKLEALDKQLAEIKKGRNFGFNICEIGTHKILDSVENGGWDVAFVKLKERIGDNVAFEVMESEGYIFVILEGSIPYSVMQLMKPCSQKGFYIEPLI